MDPEWVVLVATFLVPTALVGASAYFVLRSEKRQRQAWANVGKKLGLRVRHDRIFGRLHGYEVLVQMEYRRSARSRSGFTVVSGLLRPPLDLGLRLKRWSFLDGASILLGARGVKVVADGDEPSRVTALLDNDLRGGLLALEKSRARFELSDAGIRIEHKGQTSDERWLERALQTAAAIVGRMDKAREKVPPARPLQGHRKSWQEFAEAAGLHASGTPLGISGTAGGLSVEAYSVRVGKLDYRLDVTVRFEVPLATGFRLRLPRPLLEVVRRKNEEGDRPNLIDPKLRQELHSLVEQGLRMELDDDGVRIEAPNFPPNPDSVPRLVAQAKSIALRIRENARKPDTEHETAYR